jgi:hypothetical protein
MSQNRYQNRVMFDACEYKKKLQQSTGEIDFILDPIKYNHCGKCRPESLILGGTNVSHINGNLVDLENSLRGMTYELTECPDYKTKPLGNKWKGKSLIKPVEHPELDLNMNHLPGCMMHDVQPVPQAPQMKLSRCST